MRIVLTDMKKDDELLTSVVDLMMKIGGATNKPALDSLLTHVEDSKGNSLKLYPNGKGEMRWLTLAEIAKLDEVEPAK